MHKPRWEIKLSPVFPSTQLPVFFIKFADIPEADEDEGYSFTLKISKKSDGTDLMYLICQHRYLLSECCPDFTFTFGCMLSKYNLTYSYIRPGSATHKAEG